MTAHDIEKIVCYRCYAVLDVEDAFCRHCGASTNGTDSANQPGQTVAATPSQAVEAAPSDRPIDPCIANDRGPNESGRSPVPRRNPVDPRIDSAKLNKANHGRWMIVVLLFAVLGPGALPMLWRSDAFSLTWKIVLTVLALGATALAIWLLWYVTQMALAPLRELHGF